MKREISLSLLAWGILAAALVQPGIAQADPQVVPFTVGGVQQILLSNTPAFGGQSVSLGYDTDQNRVLQGNNVASGRGINWLDPTLYGNVNTAVSSGTGGAAWQYVNYLYPGTVTSGTAPSASWRPSGIAYIPQAFDVNTGSIFTETNGIGSAGSIAEIQAAYSSGGVDVLSEGTHASTVNKAREISISTTTLTDGGGNSLAYTGNDGTNYNFLRVCSSGILATQNIKTFTLSNTQTGWNSTTAGSRTNSATGTAVISNATLVGLVPGVDDLIKGIATDGSLTHLWIVSTVTTPGNHNYLSEMSLVGGVWTQDDLNPGSGNEYVDLGGMLPNSTNTADLYATAITVNADASKIYISGYGTSSGDPIFIFQPVPEPTTLGFLAIGGAAMMGAALRRR